MSLYHADIRLPDGFVLPSHRVALEWTRHADSARTDDRYGVIPKFETLPLSSFGVIEVEVVGKKVLKVVIRGHYSKTTDVIFVLIPGPRWKVKTVWQNLRRDTHATLDKSKYVA